MKATKEQFELVMKIAERADKMGLMMFDRMSLSMDLKCANNEFDLRLEQLLNADDFNFAHDIVGIQNNLDRKRKKMGNCFVPRYSGF